MKDLLWDLKWPILMFLVGVATTLWAYEQDVDRRRNAPCEDFAHMRAEDVPLRCLRDVR